MLHLAGPEAYEREVQEGLAGLQHLDFNGPAVLLEAFGEVDRYPLLPR